MNKNNVLEFIAKLMIEEQQKYAKIITEIDYYMPDVRCAGDTVSLLKFVSKQKSELLNTIYEQLKNM